MNPRVLRPCVLAATFGLGAVAAIAQCTDYDIVVSGGALPDEISWELVEAFGNTVTQGDAPENDGQCLDDGCYTMYMYDTGNDGWNGATFDASAMFFRLPLGSKATVTPFSTRLGVEGLSQ